MLKLKNRNDIIYSAKLVCLIDKCDEEALKLWSTDTNIIDICETHFKQLQSERYTT
jgi:hypothetical protein